MRIYGPTVVLLLGRWYCWQTLLLPTMSVCNWRLGGILLRYFFVIVAPWCPSRASRTTLSQSAPGTTMRSPHTPNPPTSANSVKTGSYCGPRVFFSGAVKYPLAIALLNFFSSGPWHVSSSRSSHETASGSTARTTALISFSNSSSSSITVHSRSGFLPWCLASWVALDAWSCKLLR